jgi:serine/threonine protein kinase
VSRYELLEEIGRGNMGVVFKARDPAMHRIVAIKIVRLGFSLDERQRASFVERFHREAQIAGRLSHPGIVAVHDFGSGEEPFLVMEHFPGVSLQKLLEGGPLAVPEVERIARQLAHALAHAHSEGVVHRDIKPSNVLYHDGKIKLVDFGIARLDASELTATGELIGTPSYMPPEIFSGARVDGQSDLFSLGAVLYQLLTGRKPFDGETVSRIIYRVLHDDPPPPSRVREGISPDWDVVVQKLLAKDRKDRYQRAEHLLADLDGMAHDEKLSAKSENEPTEPLAHPGNGPRGRKLAALVLFLVVAAVAGLFFRRPPVSESVAGTPLVFVARHEHAVGHCTGDLTLGDGIVFESSRHRDWRWRPEDVESIASQSDGELELRARSRERGKRQEMETFRFTFLRPPLAKADLERYSERLESERE